MDFYFCSKVGRFRQWSGWHFLEQPFDHHTDTSSFPSPSRWWSNWWLYHKIEDDGRVGTSHKWRALLLCTRSSRGRETGNEMGYFDLPVVHVFWFTLLIVCLNQLCNLHKGHDFEVIHSLLAWNYVFSLSFFAHLQFCYVCVMMMVIMMDVYRD